jgi:hypothetical protein
VAILHDLNEEATQKSAALSQRRNCSNDKNEGGFIRDVPLPERLLPRQNRNQVQAA